MDGAGVEMQLGLFASGLQDLITNTISNFLYYIAIYLLYRAIKSETFTINPVLMLQGKCKRQQSLEMELGISSGAVSSGL